MTAWLEQHWVASALVMGIMLLLLAPVLSFYWSAPLLWLFLQLPVYMLHQVEEHTDDRFRRFVNGKVFGGVEALTPASILVINIPGVWGVDLLCLYAGALAGPGWGLAAVYLTVVNAVAHAVAGAVKRAYNPGLWTALLLFLPVGGAALWRIGREPGVAAMQHAVGLSAAIAIHAAIIFYARIRADHLAGQM